jgi:hypothetical protein
MDDDELPKLAESNKQLIAVSSDVAYATRAIIEAFDVVIGLYPDKEEMSGWGKLVIKGAGVVEGDDTRTTALWCKSIEDAIALTQLYGDLSSSK